MKTRKIRLFAIGLAAALALPAFDLGVARAATLTWDANAATAGQTDGAGAWLTADRWWTGATNATWSDGDDAIFGNGGAGGAVTLASTATVNSLTLNYFTGTYTPGSVGQTITLNNGITMNSGAGAVTFVSPIKLGAAQTWINNTAAKTLIVDDGVNSIIDNNGFLLTFVGNNGTTGGTQFNIKHGNGITGGGGLTVDNAYLDLRQGGANSLNTYTGTTTIQNGGGILKYAQNIGGGNIILNGGIIDGYFNEGFTRTVGTGVGQIQLTGGASGFGCNGNCTITLGNVTWGTATFNPSALVLGTPTSSAGTTTFSGGINLNGTNRTVLANSSVNAGAITNVISTSSGTAGLTKAGVGNLILSANNSYDGDTTINAGTLTLSGSGAINSTSALNLGGGTLRLVNTAQVNRFADGAGITSSGGTISYENTSGANVYTETLGSVTNSNGQLNIVETVNQAGAGSQTLTLSGLTNSGSATVAFSAASSGPQGSGNKNMIVVTGGGTTDVSKIIGPWATVGTAANAQTDYAVYSSDYVLGLGAGSSVDDSGWSTTWADTNNYAWGNTTLGMTVTNGWNINTLRHTGSPETLTLSNVNLGTYGILNGVTSLLTVASTGTGALTLPDTTAGNLYVNAGSGAITINAPITDNTGNLTLVKNGTGGSIANGNVVTSVATTGALVLNGVNTYTGDTIINGGVLRIGSNGSANGAKLGGSGGNYAGNITINAGAMLYISSDAAQTLSGNISGDGSLMKSYSGTLTLIGTNTYTGKTYIQPATTSGAGIVEVYSFDYIASGSYANHGLGSSLGAPTTVANGTVELGGPFNTVQGGATLRYLGAGETSDRIINIYFGSSTTRAVENNGTGLLKFTNPFTSTGGTVGGTIALQGSSDVEVVGGLPFGGAYALTKSGNGTWTLGGAVGNTGVLTVNAGTLALQRKSSLMGGLMSNWTAAKINVKSGATLALNVDSVDAAGLSSASLDTLLSAISVAGSATAGLQSGAKLGFDTSTATDGIFTQGVAIANSTGANGGAISVTKLGAGTLVLDKVNSYTGATTIVAGTLRVDGSLSADSAVTVVGGTLGGTGTVGGSVTNNATVAPGASAGTLIVGGNFVQATNGSLNIEIGGAAPGSYDVLAVSNSATLSGTLNVTLTNSYTGVANDSFTILTASTVSGTFTTTNLPALATGSVWNVEYQSGAVVLSITNAGGPPPATGYDLYATGITNGATSYQGDGDGDGYANLLEYVTGGDANNADAVARMNGTRVGGLLALQFTRTSNSVDTTLIVEGSNASTNDANWIGIATNIGGSWGSATNVVETNGPSIFNVTAYDTSPSTNRFLRLRVTRP